MSIDTFTNHLKDDFNGVFILMINLLRHKKRDTAQQTWQLTYNMRIKTFLWLSVFIFSTGCLYADSDHIVLVEGTISTPNKAESRYAMLTNRRISRWLNEMNISHSLVNDKIISRKILKNTKIIILPYNPHPDSRELAIFKQFINKGGKIIVFYSSSPDLARMMNMRLGKYIAGKQWRVIYFNKSAPAHIPELVFQESHNIRPVYPRGNNSKVIALWGGTTDPAWVQSENGLWMSHILLDNGDTLNKKRMLLGLIALYDHDVWRSAAEGCMNARGKLDGKFKNLPDAVRGIIKLARKAQKEQKVKSILSGTGLINYNLRNLFKEHRYVDVVEKSDALQALLLKAYSSAQSSRKKEFRGVWDHSGLGLYRGDWNKTCRILANYGITDIIPNMLWPDWAHYDSNVLPSSEGFRLYGDQVKACVSAAHKYGIRVHIWKVCWKLSKTSPAFVKRMRKQNRLQVTDQGQTIEWLCPSNPDNQAMELKSIKEIVIKYPIDGVHLDYIRYRDSHVCYDRMCKLAFEKEIGKKTDNWPEDVLKGKLKEEYNLWRSNQINNFIKKADNIINKINPEVKLSAAVFGKYPMCIKSVGQDWALWLQNNYIDFVCPMNYTEDLNNFKKLTEDQLLLQGTSGKLFPGIGVTASESRLTPIQTIDQITILRKQGAEGFVLFDLNKILEMEIIPVLRQGITESAIKGTDQFSPLRN